MDQARGLTMPELSRLSTMLIPHAAFYFRDPFVEKFHGIVVAGLSYFVTPFEQAVQQFAICDFRDLLVEERECFALCVARTGSSHFGTPFKQSVQQFAINSLRTGFLR